MPSSSDDSTANDVDVHKSTTETNDSQTDDDDTNLTLRIQTSTGRPQTVSVVETASVAALKQTVAATCNSSNTSSCNPYIRLIAAGRLLAPDTASLRDFQLQSEQVVHAVIVQSTSGRGGVQAALQQGQAVTTASAGVNARGWAVRRPEHGAEDEDDSEDDGVIYADADAIDLEAGTAGTSTTRQRNTTTTTSPHRIPMGFDQLRVSAGLRRSEIMAIRLYFHGAIDRWIQQNPDIAQEIERLEPHDALRRRRIQEERWADTQGPNSEYRINLQLDAAQTTSPSPQLLRTPVGALVRGGTTVGTDRDFVWGFLLGFCVGFLMLVWVWIPTVPHKQKLGILTGYCFHLTLGMVRNSGGSVPEGQYTDDVLMLSD